MKSIEFSYNWNNKLDCIVFTTIRASNKYQVGEEYAIKLKGKEIGIGKIIDVLRFTLKELPKRVAWLDTGYSLEKCKSVIREMYKNKIDVENHVFSLYFIQKRTKDLFD